MVQELYKSGSSERLPQHAPGPRQRMEGVTYGAPGSVRVSPAVVPADDLPKVRTRVTTALQGEHQVARLEVDGRTLTASWTQIHLPSLILTGPAHRHIINLKSKI